LTIGLAAVAQAAAVVLGLGVALLRGSSVRPLRWGAAGYVWLFRAVPTLLWDGRFALLTVLLAGFGRASAEVGAVMGAYLVTSITKVPRFAATVAVTPLVARAWARVTGRRAGRPSGGA